MERTILTGFLSLSKRHRCLQCRALQSQLLRKPLQHKSSYLQLTRSYARGSSRRKYTNPIVSYLRTLRWVPIPLSVGFAYISYQQFGHVIRREQKILETSDSEDRLAADWAVRMYRCLPLKIISRLWGKINSIDLPIWMRSPLFRSYSRIFGCDIEEAAIRDLEYYTNLSEFFRRRLRPGARPIDLKNALVCPSDGIVLHLGQADAGVLEQVKGITYHLSEFLGPINWTDLKDQVVQPNGQTERGQTSGKRFAHELKSSPDNELYHCVIYLAPGDYHGFHSPSQWVVTKRRHFPGELLSVNPGIARLVKGLFNVNERAVYLGHWQHGFFSMAAVGATNVGNIKVYHDKCLTTNDVGRFTEGQYDDLAFHAKDVAGIHLKKGEPFGEFRLGSTIVLVFEAPKEFKFRIKPGQKVKYGQALGTV